MAALIFFSLVVAISAQKNNETWSTPAETGRRLDGKCEIHETSDCFGQDLRGVKAHSTGECCNICESDRNCRAFSFAHSQNMCYLKFGCDKRVQHGDCTAGIVPERPPSETDQRLINEYNDHSMGIGFTMISPDGWYSGLWGVVPEPAREYVGYLQTFVSVTTSKYDMATYQNRPWGLAMHISPESEFWKDFQVIGLGGTAGNIVGGPGDGGSHTPGGAGWRRIARNEGKDYKWFTEQKNGILARYNEVYHNHDYNEFITNGITSSSVAGVFFYERSSGGDQNSVQESAMCSFLARNCPWRKEPWPMYAYNWGGGKGWIYIKKYLYCPQTVLV